METFLSFPEGGAEALNYSLANHRNDEVQCDQGFRIESTVKSELQ